MADSSGADGDLVDLSQLLSFDLESVKRGAYESAYLLWDEWMAFASAVDWTEPFVLGLLSFHLSLLLLIVTTRRVFAFQCFLFFALSCLLVAGGSLNSLGAVHWRAFATQDYFDEHGIFFGAMWASPLLLMQIAMLIAFLRNAARLLVTVKRLELRSRAAQEGKAAGGKEKKKKE